MPKAAAQAPRLLNYSYMKVPGQSPVRLHGRRRYRRDGRSRIVANGRLPGCPLFFTM